MGTGSREIVHQNYGPGMPKAEVNGIAIEYDVQGDGEPCSWAWDLGAS